MSTYKTATDNFIHKSPCKMRLNKPKSHSIECFIALASCEENMVLVRFFAA